MNFYQTALTLLAGLGLLTACSDDDWKDDVSALQKPTPSSIVLLDDEGGMVVKGSMFQLRFRVNPSGVTLTKDDVKLDLQNSDTYYYVPSDATGQTRASYVSPSDYYELLSVEPDRNEAGDTLDGQWIATIQTRGEDNFRNVADLHLVVDYVDAAGVPQEVSSPGVPLEIIPTVDEGIDFGYSKVQTYRTEKGEVNPYYLFYDAHTYVSPSGGSWQYSWNYVNNTRVESADSVIVHAEDFYEKHYVTFTSVDSKKWDPIDSGEAKLLTDTLHVTVTDVGGMTKELALLRSYSSATIPIDIELSASEINAALAAGTRNYNYDLAAAMVDYGFTEDVFTHLQRVIVYPEIHSSLKELPIALHALTGIDRGSFKPVLPLTFLGELTPGTSSEDGSYSLTLRTATYGQDVDSMDFIYVTTPKVDIHIRVTD